MSGGASVRRHILVAEDDESAAVVLRMVLEREGYRVTLVSNGPAARQVIEETGPPDVAVLDWMLPDMSGLELCHWLRERWNPLQLPILLVTARADAESISVAFDAGASDYIVKPFLGAELRARVASHVRNKQLVEERAEIEEHLRERERLSALGLLVSGVAHDLNNPLASISGHAQLLLQDERDAESSEDLRRILQEVERCRKIVANLLSFARRHPPEREMVSLQAVLRDTLELREHHLRRSGVAADLSTCGVWPSVYGDAHQLQQVFLNILLNAEQALRHGGGVLRIDCTIDDSLTPAGAPLRQATIEFFNDGPVIPPDVLPHIFEPFFTTKNSDEGTGLGLAISRRVLQEHGGSITVHSDAGGTTFRIQVPAV